MMAIPAHHNFNALIIIFDNHSIIINMKKLILGLSIIATSFFSVSCEQCVTCTFDDPDQGVIEDNFCGSGATLEDQETLHEDNGWSCTND